MFYLLLALPWIVQGAAQTMSTTGNSPREWLPVDAPSRRAYDYYVARFGSGDVLVASWPGCSVDDPRLREVGERLASSRPFLDRHGRPLIERVVSAGTLLDALRRGGAIPEGEARKRLQGTLLGPDGRTTALYMQFAPSALAQRSRLVPQVANTLADTFGVASTSIHLAGPVMDGLSVDRASQRSLDAFAVPSMLIVLGVTIFCLNSIRLGLLITGAAILAQGTVLALMHYTGHQLTALDVVMPPLVQVLTVAAGIHLVNYYLDTKRQADCRVPELEAVRQGWQPIVLSAVTTALGLLSLAVSRLAPIRAFGLFGAIGVTVAAVLVIGLLPGGLLWMNDQSGQKGADSHDAAAQGRTLATNRWQLPRWIAGYDKLVVASALVVMAGAGWGALQLKTSVRLDTLFSQKSKILHDYRWIEEHVGPLVPLEILLVTPTEVPLTEQMQLAQRVEKRLAEFSEVRGTLSPWTFAPTAGSDSSMAPQGASHGSVWSALLSQVGFLHRGPDRDTLRVMAYVSANDPLDYDRLLRRLHDATVPLLAGGQARALFTGTMPLVHSIQKQLLGDLLKSFLTALVIILMVIALVQGGVAAGMVTMIPNVFPALLVFGLLGWMRWPIDLGSVMTASVALGVAVDDTLHFLTFFQRARWSGATRKASVDYAYGQCARAMTQTTVICTTGLSVFALSDFVPACRFAWMMAALLLLALLGDLVVLPALLIGPLGRLWEGADRPVDARPEQARPVTARDPSEPTAKGPPRSPGPARTPSSPAV